MYSRLITAKARRIPSILFCEATKFADELLVNQEICDIIHDRSARILAIMDAPAQDFFDFPCVDVVGRLTNRVKGALDVALVIDMDWSNTIKTHPCGHKASPPHDYPGRPELYNDPKGPRELMEKISWRYPSVNQVLVTDATIHHEVENYVQSLTTN